MIAPQQQKAPTTYSVPTLKERGWTEALIKKFLGEPDVLKTNPRYKSAAPMRLYNTDRVEECEQSQDWQEAATRAQSRSKRGKEVAQRRAAELLKAIETLPITVQRLPLDTLLMEAIEAYNNFHSILLIERGHDYEPASKQSDPAFLERITVNYIRHHLTEYDSHLEEVAGRVGVREAIDAIRDRVYAEIAKQYPEYTEECQRQIRYRKGEPAQ
jgi:hypothetical protein